MSGCNGCLLFYRDENFNLNLKKKINRQKTSKTRPAPLMNYDTDSESGLEELSRSHTVRHTRFQLFNFVIKGRTHGQRVCRVMIGGQGSWAKGIKGIEGSEGGQGKGKGKGEEGEIAELKGWGEF